MGEPLSSALLGKRIRAGMLDAVVLGGISALYFFIPLLTTGLVLPMWGVLAAGIGYAVVPIAAFRASLGMRVFRVELRGRDDRAANPADLLFRELVGRGLLPGAFLFTLVMSGLGAFLGLTHFVMPTGLGLVMALGSLLTLAVVVPGHFLPLFRPDRRSLADLLSRTRVVERQPAPVPEDEDERAFQHSQHRNRVIAVAVFEVILLVGALALPWLLTGRTTSTEEYADRLTRMRMEKEFERSPGSEVATQQLVGAYRKARRFEDAQKTLARHGEAVLDGLTCDERGALATGDRMNQRGDYEQAIRWVKRYEEKCGGWPRLLWVSVYAHQQREEWKEVAAETTRLIENEPDDSDFWWWRGEAYAQAGDAEQAAADYQQSMAKEVNSFAAGRYAALAGGALRRPCDGAFALWYWMEQQDDDTEVGPQASAQRDRLFRTGECEKQLGQGRVTVSSASKLEVGGKTAGLDGRAWPGYTLLSSRFAADAGVIPEKEEQVRLWVTDEWVQAKLATVPEVRLGRAKATQVRVAIVDRMPEGVDAVLGVNLAWRFAVKRDAETTLLTPRARK